MAKQLPPNLEPTIKDLQAKLAEDVKAISRAARVLKDGPLKWDVVVKLVSWKSGVSMTDTEQLLNTIVSLDRELLK